MQISDGRQYGEYDKNNFTIEFVLDRHRIGLWVVCAA